MADILDPESGGPQVLHMSRRTVVKGALFTGFAVAVASASAEPVHTGEQGLITEVVTLAASIPAYIARPSVSGRHPAVLVIHEAFGLHEYVRDVCRRLARLGYVAIAPAFFVRIGDPAPLATLPEVMEVVNATTDEQVIGDMEAAVAFLKSQPYVDITRLGVTGFCWGGRWAWLACAIIPEVKAGVAWYGFMVPTPVNHMVPSDTVPPAPDRLWPINYVEQLHAPVLGLYGGLDPVTITEPAMSAALKEHNKVGSEIIVYPDAGHGFHADYREGYIEKDAEDGWNRLVEHFQRNGV